VKLISKIGPALFLFFVIQQIAAQVPPGYYDNAAGLNGTQLQEALHEIIDDHTASTYSELWALLS